MGTKETRIKLLQEDIALCKLKIKQVCDIDWFVVYNFDDKIASDAGLGQSEIIILYAKVMAKLQVQLNLEILNGN